MSLEGHLILDSLSRMWIQLWGLPIKWALNSIRKDLIALIPCMYLDMQFNTVVYKIHSWVKRRDDLLPPESPTQQLPEWDNPDQTDKCRHLWTCVLKWSTLRIQKTRTGTLEYVFVCECTHVCALMCVCVGSVTWGEVQIIRRKGK